MGTMDTFATETTNTMMFQPMPDLTEDQLDALRADISANGVLVPVVVDQHGRLLDGHNRRRIAHELGIECPTVVKAVTDDDEAADLAVSLNCARRHLSQDQKRDLIRAELLRRPEDSDRAVARRVGCSPTTVGTVRTQVRQEAQERLDTIHHAMRQASTNLFRACADAVMLGVDPRPLITLLSECRDANQKAAREAGKLPIAIWGRAELRALIAGYVYTTAANDLGDVVNLVEADGVSFPLPRRLSEDDLADLTETTLEGIRAVTRLSNLDTQPIAAEVSR